MDSDSFGSDSDDNGWDFQGEEQDLDCTDVQSLFSEKRFADVESTVAFDSENFGFNFSNYRKQVGLDDIETIMCINFIRVQHASGQDVLSTLAEAASGNSRPWKADEYMRQAIPNDALLMHDWDDDDFMDMEIRPLDVSSSAKEQKQPDANASMDVLLRENGILRSAVHCLAEYLPEDVRNEILGRVAGGNDIAALVDEIDLGPSTSGRSMAQPLQDQRQPGGRSKQAADATYFNSYSHLGIHREMLSDKARTLAYKEAIEGNGRLFAGAEVLDVGCGTGILSLMAARAGAAKVIGVDGSKSIARLAEQICLENRLSGQEGGPITILEGRVEDIENLPIEKVNVIVSEWMGYTLLFETMLDSVLFARDRWLKPGGAMLPDMATLYLAGTDSNALDTSFWKDVYGFSMEAVADSIVKENHGKAVVTEIAPSSLVTKPFPIKSFDLSTMQVEDADFSTNFALPLLEGTQTTCHAIVIWFDVEFSERFCSQQPVTLSTSPYMPKTHWGQTVLPLRTPVSLESLRKGGGELLGRISIARSHVHRSLDISLEYAAGNISSHEKTAEAYSIAMC